MLIFFCSLFCENIRLIVRDESRTAIKSTETFKTANQHFLHDYLQEYMDKYRVNPSYLSVFDKIREYILVKDKPITLDELKLFFLTNILHVYGLGKFNMNLLCLTSEFDNDLLKHMDIILAWETEALLDSVCKNFIQYDYPTFVLNKSLSFMHQFYVKYMHDIITSQMRTNEWRYESENTFGIKVTSIMRTQEILDFILKQDNTENVHVNLKCIDIVSRSAGFKNAIAQIKEKFANKILEVYFLYSNVEMLDALSCHFEATRIEDSGARKPIFDMINNLSKMYDFGLQHGNQQKMWLGSTRIEKVYLLSYQADRYSYFFGTKTVRFDNLEHDKWSVNVKPFSYDVAGLNMFFDLRLNQHLTVVRSGNKIID